MPSTTKKDFQLPTGQTKQEIEHFWQVFKNSIIEMDSNSVFSAPFRSAGKDIYFDHFRFNTELDSDSRPTLSGAMYWDNDDQTPVVNMPPANGDSVKLSLGQEMYIRAVNKSGTTISNGEVVYVDGAQGNRPTIALANASTYATATRVIGLSTEEIPNNQAGYVTTHGLVRDLDTSAYTEGDCLYLSTVSGQFGTVSPGDGTARIKVGLITKSHVTDGWVCVNVTEDKYMFGDPDTGSMSLFEADGTYVANGNAITWEDLQFSVSTGKVPASNFPTYETFTTNTQQYAFSVNDYIDLSTNEPPHAHKQNTDASFHIHIVPKTANSSGSSQYVKFQLNVAYAGSGDVWDEVTLTTEEEIPNGTSALTSFISGGATFDLTGLGIGGQICLRLTRISATGGTEYADDVYLTQVGMHYQQDTMGSRQMIVK